MLARYDRAVQRTATRRPTLVIVSGAPGTGKSTLAARLSKKLHVPLLAKDELKETLADALGTPGDVGASQQLGVAAYAVLFLVARQILEGGSSVIVESNFRRSLSERELAQLAASADVRLIHCDVPHAEVERRYLARAETGDRHPAHRDHDRRAALAADLAAGHFEPLALGGSTLVVDTSDGYRPSFETIAAFAAGEQ